ncbi:hypothetical protein HHK36_017054 [Tetracentron sinense]|uniref:DNA topoisomerase (ATP-hydrolyzing) n=1 Tax=Tetracentron sinense TaxID=13715 RepID=A0A835DC69_TETSI|nr:hypothetical protein HHK36_017054 [Tetracentron sinense]
MSPAPRPQSTWKKHRRASSIEHINGFREGWIAETVNDSFGVVESLLSWADFKQSKDLKKTNGTKRQRIIRITKLEDANDAKGRNSDKCTLILAEGDLAKALAVSSYTSSAKTTGIPLRGKLLHVREANHSQIMDNAEIQNITQILRLTWHALLLEHPFVKETSDELEARVCQVLDRLENNSPIVKGANNIDQINKALALVLLLSNWAVLQFFQHYLLSVQILLGTRISITYYAVRINCSSNLYRDHNNPGSNQLLRIILNLVAARALHSSMQHDEMICELIGFTPAILISMKSSDGSDFTAKLMSTDASSIEPDLDVVGPTFWLYAVTPTGVRRSDIYADHTVEWVPLKEHSLLNDGQRIFLAATLSRLLAIGKLQTKDKRWRTICGDFAGSLALIKVCWIMSPKMTAREALWAYTLLRWAEYLLPQNEVFAHVNNSRRGKCTINFGNYWMLSMNLVRDYSSAKVEPRSLYQVPNIHTHLKRIKVAEASEYESSEEEEREEEVLYHLAVMRFVRLPCLDSLNGLNIREPGPLV